MMQNKKLLHSLFILFAVVCLFIGYSVARAETLTSNNESSNTSDTAIVFSVPGWDAEEVSNGDSKWDASEMNLKFKAVYPYANLNTGYFLVKMYADMSTMLDTEINMDLLINEVNYSSEMMTSVVFKTCGEKLEVCNVNNGNIYVLDGKLYVVVAIPYNNTEPYNVRSNVLQFTLKTHSAISETVGPFYFTDLIVCDSENGAYSLELDKAIYKCEKFNYWRSKHTPLDYSVIKNGQRLDVSKNKLVDFLPERNLSTSVGNDSIYFGDSKSANANIQGYMPINALSSGIVQSMICVRNFDLADGRYKLKCKLNDTNGTTICDVSEDIVVVDGIAQSNSSTNKDFKTFIPITFRYNLIGSNILPKSKLMVYFCLKNDNGDVVNSFFLESVLFIDYQYGASLMDLKYCNLSKGLVRKTSNADILVANVASLFVVGDEYVPEIISDLYSGKKDIAITSSDESVVKVVKKASKGKKDSFVLQAVSSGSATITVSDNTNNCSYTFEQIVKEPHFSLITERTKIPVAGQYYFGVKANGFKAESKKWSSSNKKIGTIDESTGLFTGKKPGTTTIMVEDASGIKFSFDVQVVEDNVDISKLIKITANSDAPSGLDKTIYNHLATIYKPMMAMFGGEDRTPVVDVTFKSLEGTGAAAYVSWSVGMEYGEQTSFPMVIGIETMVNNIEDIDCSTHEFMHVAQGYVNSSDAYGNNATWLTEGLADYARYLFAQNDDKSGWTMTEYYSGSNYDTGYGVTGSFIKFVADNYEPSIAECLNEIMKKHKYTHKIWEDVTGYTVEALWKKYVGYSWLSGL